VKGIDGHDVREGRLPLRDRAGLVQDDRLQLVGRLQRLGRADQHAVLGTLARPHHDRQRCGQPKGAGAGDDEHRHRGDERECERRARTEVEPNDEGADRDEDHRRHEVAGDQVGKPLDRRLRGLGLLHELDDLGEHRVRTDLGGAEPEGTGLVDRGADDRLARSLRRRDGFAGDHGLVDRGSSVHDLPVDGDLLPRADRQDVADLHVLHGDLLLLATLYDARGLGLQADQLADRLAGAGLGAGLEQTAEQDQGEDHPHGFEVDLAKVLGKQARGDRHEEAVGERDAGADGDQRVHVCRAVAKGQPPGAMDGPARVEHHGGDQDELEPALEHDLGHPRRLEELARHRGEQHGRGEDRADSDAPGEVPDLRPSGGGLSVLGLLQTRLRPLLHSIASSSDRLLHVPDLDLRGIERHADALGAEVDLDIIDPGHPVQERFDVPHARRARDAATAKPELHPARSLDLANGSHANGPRHLVRVGVGLLVEVFQDRGRPNASSAVAVARFDDERPVQHVHPAGEAILARARRHEVHDGPPERGERLAHPEVGEHDAGRAIAVLLPVEHEPKRHPFLHPDEVRGVAAPDGDLHLLDAAPDLRPAGLFGSEEEVRERPGEGDPARGDQDLGSRHTDLARSLLGPPGKGWRPRSACTQRPATSRSFDSYTPVGYYRQRGIRRRALEAIVATQTRGYTATRDQLLDRLARIAGQVGGVARMVEADRYCIDVVTQINAARAALDKVALGLLDGHVRHCLVGGHGGPSDPDEQAEELMGAVGRMLSR
jgi:DNA-binding FrmR family transcriptional regulator